MQLRSIRDIKNLKGKTVLYRVAYDIDPIEENGKFVIRDTTRIKATLPTLHALIEQGCKIVLLTWVKRPAGKVVEKLRTAPHAEALAELLGRPVRHVNDCVGEEADRAVASLKAGELLMLENVRFHQEEEYADPAFSKALCKGKDLIVYDAFAQAHRVHSSTTGILGILLSVAGRLMEEEFRAFESILEHPKRPLIAFLGGAKVSDKVSTIRFLLTKVDLLLIGGALASTFFSGLGKEVGASLVESVAVDEEQKSMNIPALAAGLTRAAPLPDHTLGWPSEISSRLVLPLDLVAASKQEKGATTKIIDMDHESSVIPSGWTYLDIGPRTIDLYCRVIAHARTIFWNGPMGYFELDAFSHGTRSIADAIIASKAFSVIGGGDTETIVEKYHFEGKFSHVSTGGGVSLEILAGKELPVLQYLKK